MIKSLLYPIITHIIMTATKSKNTTHSFIISHADILQLKNWIPNYFTFGSWNHCFYCGDIPNAQDHVIPWSMMSLLDHSGDSKGPKTPVCTQCNLILSSYYFDTLHERCLYAKQYLCKKYNKLSKMPEWQPSDIQQLKGKLKSHIQHQQQLKSQITPRLLWQNSNTFISLFDEAYKQSLYQLPHNQKFHSFMMPHWLLPSTS